MTLTKYRTNDVEEIAVLVCGVTDQPPCSFQGKSGLSRILRKIDNNNSNSAAVNLNNLLENNTEINYCLYGQRRNDMQRPSIMGRRWQSTKSIKKIPFGSPLDSVWSTDLSSSGDSIPSLCDLSTSSSEAGDSAYSMTSDESRFSDSFLLDHGRVDSIGEKLLVTRNSLPSLKIRIPPIASIGKSGGDFKNRTGDPKESTESQYAESNCIQPHALQYHSTSSSVTTENDVVHGISCLSLECESSDEPLLSATHTEGKRPFVPCTYQQYTISLSRPHATYAVVV